jgi:hypothetical protein
VDAISVETGVGPECRKKHGYDDAQGPADWTAVGAALLSIPDMGRLSAKQWDSRDAHAVANVLVHRAAIEQGNPAIVVALVAAIAALGYTKLAARIAKNAVGIVQIAAAPGGFTLKAGYSPEFLAALRTVGARTSWDRPSKLRAFEAADACLVVIALAKAFPRAMVALPSGAVVTLDGAATWATSLPAAPRAAAPAPVAARSIAVGTWVRVTSGPSAGLEGAVGWAGSGRVGIKVHGQRGYTFVDGRACSVDEEVAA